jgi:hypothetical protein
MTAGRKRMLIHAAMAAFVLAVIGMMMAELAGLWLTGQTVERKAASASTPPASTSPPDVAVLLRWRLPVAMALAGFLLVMAGESLSSAWKKPATPPPEKRDFDKEAEAKIQLMLKGAEANKTTGERGA